METYIAYIDGSLAGAGREHVAKHLQTCNRCFETVALLRDRLEETEEAERQTPPDLLDRAQSLPLEPQTRKTPLSIYYAAAAAVVLAIGGFWFSYRTGTMPDAQTAFARIETLDENLKAHSRAWPALPPAVPGFEDMLGFAGGTITEAQAAFTSGIYLVSLKVHLEHRNDVQAAQTDLAALQSAVQHFMSSSPILDKMDVHLQANNSHQAVDLLPELQQMLQQSIDQKVYFNLATWLQTLKISLQIATHLSTPRSEITDLTTDAATALKFIDQLQALQSQAGLANVLADLAVSLDTPSSTQQSIIKQIDMVILRLSSP